MGCKKELIAPADLSNNLQETELDKAVDAIVQKHRNQLNTVGMTVGIWKDGNSNVYGYGETQKGGGQIPDAHTFFEIGSITKTFTATATVQWLNEKGFERNFYQLINGYRVEESKRLLVNEQLLHLNILAIGFEAGFNSKTTFNTTFKNQTGMSPLEYRKLQDSATGR